MTRRVLHSVLARHEATATVRTCLAGALVAMTAASFVAAAEDKPNERVIGALFGFHTVEAEPKVGLTTRIFSGALAGTRVFVKRDITSYRKYKGAFEFALPYLDPNSIVSAHLKITETGRGGSCAAKAGFVLSSYDGDGMKEVDDAEAGRTVVEVSTPPGAAQIFPDPVDVTDLVKSQVRGPLFSQPSGYIGFNIRPTDNEFCIRYISWATLIIETVPLSYTGIRG
jgi:hypothetical protein